MCDLFSLNNKNILVTGGTRGIGRAISLRLARAGASVTANHVRKLDTAESLEEMARREKLAIDICRADITSEKGKQKIITILESLKSPLSGLVHCAASGVHGSLETLTARHFNWVLSINTIAFFELVKICLPFMTDGSNIIAVSSIGALRAVNSYALVGSSKGALEALSRHLAAELANRGIRVNILSPGSVPTDAWEAMTQKEKRLTDTVGKTPIGRLVTLEEIAYAAQFLCSEASSGIVGHTMVIDGGASIME